MHISGYGVFQSGARQRAAGRPLPVSLSPCLLVSPSPPRRRGFTLVELLVVITIIGILAAFTVGAAIRVRYTSRKAAIKTELTQLDIALQHYKQKHGEFPPDFANINLPAGGANDPLRKQAQLAVLRHLRKAFPRYSLPAGDPVLPDDAPWLQFVNDVTTNYPGLNPNQFDPAAALVFWLGGLPETTAAAVWKPAGFHSDPQFPFKQGLPRTEPFYEFKTERLTAPPVASNFRYSPPGDIAAPYVYFRAQRLVGPGTSGQYEYGYVAGGNFVPLAFANTATDFAVPYLDQPLNPNANQPAPTPPRAWRNQETVQVLCAGFDNLFGGANLFRFSRVGQELDAAGNLGPMNDANFDNIANFSEGTLEDEMQK